MLQDEQLSRQRTLPPLIRSRRRQTRQHSRGRHRFDRGQCCGIRLRCFAVNAKVPKYLSLLALQKMPFSSLRGCIRHVPASKSQQMMANHFRPSLASNVGLCIQNGGSPSRSNSRCSLAIAFHCPHLPAARSTTTPTSTFNQAYSSLLSKAGSLLLTLSHVSLPLHILTIASRIWSALARTCLVLSRSRSVNELSSRLS